METNEIPLSQKAIVMANCPIKNYYEYIVTGTSTGNKGSQNYLSLYVMNIKSAKDPIKFLTKVPTDLTFTSIGWTPYGQDEQETALGYVIGGHADGSLTLWDMTQILQNAETMEQSKDFGMVSTEKFLSTPINVICINVKPNVFAVGSSYISMVSISKDLSMSLAFSCKPPDEGGYFTYLSWNEKVNHILASATNTGMTYIYDMKNKKIFLSILDQALFSERDSHNEILNTCVLWGTDGAQVIIAYDDPDFNYLTQYHMKQPKAPTAMYQNGHTLSIIDIVKNNRDPNYVLSLGRDNIVTCWSIKTKKPICKIPIDCKACQILWANKINDCFIYCDFEGNLYLKRINFSDDMNLYIEGQEIIPRWFNKQSSLSFAFGGKIYQFSQSNPAQLNVYKESGNKELIEQINKFYSKINSEDLNELLDELTSISEKEKPSSSNTSSQTLFYAALKSVYNKNIEYLFNKMDFDKTVMSNEIATALGRSKKKENKREFYTAPVEENDGDLEKLFEEPVQQQQNVVQNALTKQEILELPNTVQETFNRNINWNVGVEQKVKFSLLTGDLESAVELLFKANRFSEALLIASMRPELFDKAKKMYFNNNKDLYVKSIFPSIINNDFNLLFDFNVTKEWKEYLLYSKTYLGDTDDFSVFAEQLGDKLQSNPDIYCALVCYVLSNNYDKCVDLLYNGYMKDIEKCQAPEEKKVLLHKLFEQIMVISKILNNNGKFINANYNKCIYDYTLLLIEEGQNLIASKYLINIRNEDKGIQELYNRLYLNCEQELGSSFPRPTNPYNLVHIRTRMTPNNNYQPQRQRKGSSNSNKGMNMNMNTQNKPMPGQPMNRMGMNRMEPPKPNMGMNMNNQMGGKTPFAKVSNPPNVRAPPPRSGAFNNMNNMNNQPQQQPQQDINENKPRMNFGGPKPMGNISKPPSFKPVNPPNGSMMHNNAPMSRMAPKPPMMGHNQPSQGMSNNISNNNPTPNFGANQYNRSEPPKLNRNIPPSNMNNMNHMNNNNNAFANQNNMNNMGGQPKPQEIPKEDVQMSPEEEKMYNYFSVNAVEIYKKAYPDENKQKDFMGKINVLLSKLQNHELKIYLIKLLIDFCDQYDKGAPNSTLNKCYRRIQSNDWDKNKSWMPLLERLMNIKRA